MSTNYYLLIPETNHCTHCNRSDPPKKIHIGKHTSGWKFGFNPRFPSYAKWLEFLRWTEGQICDEYWRPISLREFEHMVAKAQSGTWYPTEAHRQTEHLDDEGYRIIHAEEFC